MTPMEETSGGDTLTGTTGTSDPTGDRLNGTGEPTSEETGGFGGETEGLPEDSGAPLTSTGTPTSDSGGDSQETEPGSDPTGLQEKSTFQKKPALTLSSEEEKKDGLGIGSNSLDSEDGDFSRLQEETSSCTP